ncbi:MAG: oligosaccharide repeat unit polymerase [Brevundimonas sp.]|nr:MAG: oligosaccharide repeat unit polymerase [Brevundimonas sp.]
MLAYLLRLPGQWPHIVILVMAVGWSLLALIASPLLTIAYQSSWRGGWLLIAYIGAFCLGSWMVSRMVPSAGTGRVAPQTFRAKQPNLGFAFLFAMFLSTLGIGLRLFDRVVLRNMSFDIGEISRRKIDVGLGAGDSALGLISGPLTGFCFLPAIIVLVYPKLVDTRWKIAALLLAAFIPFDALFFQGGTSGVAYTLLLLMSVLATRPAVPGKRRVLSLKATIGLVAGGAAALVLGAVNFAARVSNFADSLSQYLLYASASTTNVLIPSSLTLKYVDSPVFGQFIFMAYWVSSYFVQGVYNFLFVVDYSGVYQTWGATQGQLFLRAFDMLTGNATRVPASDANPLVGLYQTMFGDVFIDFGIAVGLFQCVLMGAAGAWVHRARLRGEFFGQILDPLLKTFLMMGIFVSSLSSTGLFFLLAALALIAVTAVVPPRRQRVSARL